MSISLPTGLDHRAAESPDPWCAVADALMVLSDKLRSLAGKGLPEPRMTLNIQPFGGHLKTDDETRALVDAVAGVLGVEATRNCMHDDVWHYSTRVAGAGHPKVGPVSVQTFGRISDAPPPDQAAAEEARTAELVGEPGPDAAPERYPFVWTDPEPISVIHLAAPGSPSTTCGAQVSHLEAHESVTSDMASATHEACIRLAGGPTPGITVAEAAQVLVAAVLAHEAPPMQLARALRIGLRRNGQVPRETYAEHVVAARDLLAALGVEVDR